MSRVEERLGALGVTLPDTPAPVAAYVPAVRTGNLVFTAGQIARRNGVLLHPGRVGRDVDRESAREAAAQAALQALAAIKGLVGDLDRVQRLVRVTVFVNAEPGFGEEPLVANGASELLEQIFGEAGRHARSAVGVADLPLGSSVEVELVAEVG